ncbi:MAG TPA: 3-oxoacid CoA-transferase subunit B [Gaiella sp.]|jgi:3-oxoacid CoA-transferase B subunit
MSDPKAVIAARAAEELRPGEIVNLGIGIPNLIPGFLGSETQVFLHTENGLLGVGPRPADEELDPDLIDAAKRPVTALPGAAYFDSAQSFAMIRGGHIDVAVLGALQVSAGGDIANWAVPGKDVLGVGGAMDLVVGARRVIVTMTATSSSGEPKLVPECAYPLTARGAADVVVTELSVFRFREGELVLTELLEGASIDDVRAVTTASFAVELDGAAVDAG